MACKSVDRNAFFLSMTIFGSGLMSCVFRVYYVKLFLDHYNISQPWFQFAQVVYLVWNAVNDPLFAYLQDNSEIVCFRSRRHSILYESPLYALSFLLFWFPWGQYQSHHWLIGVHLMVSLCCYDTLLTFVLLSYCSLFAEISKDLDYRLTLTRYSKLSGILASCSVTVVEFVSNGLDDFQAFQMCCIVIAFLAWISMHFTGKYVRTNPSYRYEKVTAMNKDIPESDAKSGTFGQPGKQLKEILTGDFIAVVATNFLQILHKEYGSNFMVIFGDQLIPAGDISDVTRKLIYGSTAFLPTVAVLCLSSVVSQYGYCDMIMWTYVINIILAIGMFVIGQSHTWILVAFFIIDRCLSSYIFSFFNLPLSDIIDRDQEKYGRKTPLSSSVFGYNALFTKPAVSVAPMFVVAMLNSYGYESLQNGSLTDAEHECLRNVMFNISCFLPIILSVCRIYTWSKYRVRHSHTKVAKHIET
ncbi:hypothetical protein HOLleu_18389 [Holothuria leucospilota]|uniref:Transmembrane protein 180 n=1 Tax=Holothuria leucospilota TaxID=206669 RepID=A0A9Q1C3K5_HOLLE|nr:hypothetical protein HOLleu_18389 [Holothuria leucospilota]